MESEQVQKSQIYLDYNATTPLAEDVISGVSCSLITDWENPSSSNLGAVKAREKIAKARNQVAHMLNCSSSEIIFTSGGTEANNMIIHSAVRYFEKHTKIIGINQKPHIITSNVEHDSVILPINHLAGRSIANCTIVGVNDKGCLDVNEILAAITEQTCLITIMYANNETGVIMPIPEIGEQLSHINETRQTLNLPKILFHTDAAQIVGKETVNFHASNVDFMTIVGHKFYGPRIGCICAKEKIFPLFFGGGQENGIRPGTENTPMIVGLGIAAQLISTNIQTYRTNMLHCRDLLESKLKETFGNDVVINCKDSVRLPNTSNVSFRGYGLHGPLILSRCKSIVASVGSACHGGQCSQVLINSGVPLELAKNALRLSTGRGTTPGDVENAVLDIEAAVKKLKIEISNGSEL